MDNLLWLLLVGLIAGWLAGQVMRGGGYGLIGDMIVGVLGSLIGGYLFGQLGVGAGYGLLGSILTAFVGALILLFLLRVLHRGNDRRLP